MVEWWRSKVRTNVYIKVATFVHMHWATGTPGPNSIYPIDWLQLSSTSVGGFSLVGVSAEFGSLGGMLIGWSQYIGP